MANNKVVALITYQSGGNEEFAFFIPEKLYASLKSGIIHDIILQPGEADEFLNYIHKHQITSNLTFENIDDHLNRFRDVKAGIFRKSP